MTSRLHLDPQDAEALLLALPRLPGREEPFSPLTLDLKAPIAVRARDEKGPAAEVVLERCRSEGKAWQVVMDRRYLHRAIQLGFREIGIVQPDRPLLCKDDNRIFVWMPLTDSQVVSAENAKQVQAPAKTPPNNNSDHRQHRRAEPMPVNDPRPSNDPRNGIQDSDQFDLIAEAESLRVQLQQAVASTTRLIAALKHQRRQSRAMQAAMASLRRLQIDH